MHWLIGGASRGLGAALYAHLYRKSVQDSTISVLGLARHSDHLDEQTKLQPNTLKTRLAEIDLQDTVATSHAINEFLPATTRGVVVVNCAATWTGGKTTLELTAEDYQTAFSLNFLTAVNLCQSALKHWEQNNKSYPLTIINLGATASTRGGKNTSSFAVSKSALRIYSQSMAKELGPLGVHICHLIVDGLIDNPRTRDLNEGREPNKYLKQSSLIQTIEQLADQSPDCWTFELDLRPYNEKW